MFFLILLLIFAPLVFLLGGVLMAGLVLWSMVMAVVLIFRAAFAVLGSISVEHEER